MGPRDVELGWIERFAGISVDAVVQLTNLISDSARGRYDRDRAVLTISGESEHAGDRFARGRAVSLLTMIPMLAWMAVTVVLLGLGGVTTTALGETVAFVPLVLTVVTSITGLITVHGASSLQDKISVVDHTTEPTPDALAELQQQYVDGEIDEAELAERAAEVWER